MIIKFDKLKKNRKPITESEKQTFVFKALCAEYKAVDEETNAVNIPYFLRASLKLREIIQNDELEKEYKKYLKKEGK